MRCKLVPAAAVGRPAQVAAVGKVILLITQQLPVTGAMAGVPPVVAVAGLQDRLEQTETAEEMVPHKLVTLIHRLPAGPEALAAHLFIVGMALVALEVALRLRVAGPLILVALAEELAQLSSLIMGNSNGAVYQN